MTSPDDKLSHIREFCNSILDPSELSAYGLACDIRDYIDGDTDDLPL